MENKELEEIIVNKSNKSNKELANILLTLKVDFDTTKKTILEITNILKEIEITYDSVYEELQSRLKFKDNENEG
jgi:hypothetical protein